MGCTLKRAFLVVLGIFLALGSRAQTKVYENLVDTGYATYYAKRFEGRKTASGERFSHQKQTCAHLTLPFGTKVKVTRLDNQKSTIVVVNDRGPHVKKNIIDLTRSAAQELDMIRAGRVLVKIEVLTE